MATSYCTKEDPRGKFCNRRGTRGKGLLGRSSEELAGGGGFISHKETGGVLASSSPRDACGLSSSLLHFKNFSTTCSCPGTGEAKGRGRGFSCCSSFQPSCLDDLKGLVPPKRFYDSMKIRTPPGWSLWQVWVIYQRWDQTYSERSWGAKPFPHQWETYLLCNQ